MQVHTEAPVQEPRSLQRPGIALDGVERRFGRRSPVVALRGLDLRVDEGEVLAVVGPSGCGKSTLLELVAGLQQPDAGSVEVAGATAYMPQRDLLLPWRDALGNAALALECQGEAKAAARERAAALFERFGLADFERARPSELSGGMRQRVAFLRTLLRAPGAAPRRAVRRARLDHALVDAGVARGARAGGPAHGAARDPRRGGGGAARRPRGRALPAPRAGRGGARGACTRPRRRRDLGDSAFVELVSAPSRRWR